MRKIKTQKSVLILSEQQINSKNIGKKFLKKEKRREREIFLN